MLFSNSNYCENFLLTWLKEFYIFLRESLIVHQIYGSVLIVCMHQCSTTLVKVIFYVKTSNRIANELKDHGEGYSKEILYDETRQITTFDFFWKFLRTLIIMKSKQIIFVMEMILQKKRFLPQISTTSVIHNV